MVDPSGVAWVRCCIRAAAAVLIIVCLLCRVISVVQQARQGNLPKLRLKS